MILPKVIIITGPTASGKTVLSLKLAKKFDGEIISADSRQIYRGMTIGTAKPNAKELKTIKHHLIDIKTPKQNYSLGQYKKDADKAIKNIIKKKQIPFLVGGTGLYISSIINNLKIPEVKPKKQLRNKLEKLLKKHGAFYLYNKLIALDPEASYIIDSKNPRRLIRALEIAISTKRPFSETRKKGKPLFDFLILGMDIKPDKLKNNISNRTDKMFKLGLTREVKNLVKKYGEKRIPFDAIGYREIIEHLNRRLSLEETKKKIKKDTWRFSRKQMSWFRRMPIVWIKNQRQAEKQIKAFLSKAY